MHPRRPRVPTVLQRDSSAHTMHEDSTRCTDILIGQYRVDSEPTKQYNQNQAMDLSRGAAVT
jgi:hypothetical protein